MLRYCPDCRAPNPERLTACYACGQSLSKRREGLPAPGEDSYTCQNCGGQMSYTASQCPRCGRAVSTTDPASLSRVEDLLLRDTGWQVQSLPDGTIQLHDDGSAGWNYTLPGFLLFGFILVVTGVMVFDASLRLPIEPLLVMASSITCLFLFYTGRFAKKAWRVGPGFLEDGGRGILSGRRFHGSNVLLYVRKEGYSRRIGMEYEYTLSAEVGEKKRSLYTGCRSTLWGGAVVADYSDRVFALANFLSQTTGWTLVDLTGDPLE
jgi:hypothetical protein